MSNTKEDGEEAIAVTASLGPRDVEVGDGARALVQIP